MRRSSSLPTLLSGPGTTLRPSSALAVREAWLRLPWPPDGAGWGWGAGCGVSARATC